MDYLLESVAATSVLIVGLGRVVQDLLLWCTMEFGYLRLSDGFVQGSSIMPQKRNPVALEHARAIGSKAVGQAQAITTAVHNTPFGDVVDTEDDLQPLVASMFRDATRTVTLVAAAMRLADFDVERLAARAGEGGTTLTELADTLVRDHGLPFRSAHAIAALLLKARTEDPDAALSSALAKASKAILGRSLDYSDADLQRIMSPAHFVNVRTTHGGPAPSETGRAIAESTRLLQADRDAWKTRRERLDARRNAARREGQARYDADAAHLRARGDRVGRHARRALHASSGTTPARPLMHRLALMSPSTGGSSGSTSSGSCGTASG